MRILTLILPWIKWYRLLETKAENVAAKTEDAVAKTEDVAAKTEDVVAGVETEVTENREEPVREVETQDVAPQDIAKTENDSKTEQEPVKEAIEPDRVENLKIGMFPMKWQKAPPDLCFRVSDLAIP